jgi:hypothetical protein
MLRACNTLLYVPKNNKYYLFEKGTILTIFTAYKKEMVNEISDKRYE